MKTNQTCVSPISIQRARFWRLSCAMGALAVAVLLADSTQAADILWGLTNSGASTGNWSSGGSWVGGVVPTASDNAVFSRTNIDVPTVTVNVSTNIQNLTFLSLSNLVADTVGSSNIFAPGTTLSVLGPNGLIAQHVATTAGLGFKIKRIYTFSGNGTLLVSNPAASFVLNSGQGYGNSSSSSGIDTYSLIGLTNLTFNGNVFGAADFNLAGGVALGDQGVLVTLAQTNIITASVTNDFTQLDFTNSVEIGRCGNAVATALVANSQYELGNYNAFYCDSIGIGRGCIGGNTATMSMSALSAANGKNAAGFQVSFVSVNSASPKNSAIFRNTNGVSRMSLLAIGVDSGTTLTNSRNNGILNLIGGKVDMLVDKVWLGRNRTNAVGNSDCGGLSFDNGTVNANIVEAGYMQYTNVANCIGLILVGTNGTLQVNNYLDLGYTPADPTASFPLPESLTSGQVQINSGGTLIANKITVGALSTNDLITVNAGGLLVVSNNIADSTKSLTTLNLGNGARVTFFVTSTTTNAYVTNLLTGASAAYFNIASFNTNGITTWPVTNTLVIYQTAGAHNVSIGNKSTVATNLNMYVKDDTANNRIILITSTNVQQNLVWVGSLGNTQWDHSSPNWSNIVNSAITQFSDNDIVTFNDAASPGNYNITRSEERRVGKEC